MIGVSVRADLSRANRALTGVQKRAVPRAAGRALNRARNTTQTHTIRSTARTLQAPQKRLRRRILKALRRNARANRLKASFTVGVLPVPAEELGRFRQTSAGVVIGQIGTFRGAFIAQMPSGHIGVYRRYGSRVQVNTSRFGQQRKQRIAKVTFDISPVVRRVGERALRQEGQPAFRKRFDHELRRELAKLGL